MGDSEGLWGIQMDYSGFRGTMGDSEGLLEIKTDYGASTGTMWPPKIKLVKSDST